MDIKKTRFKNELKYPDLLNPILEILKNNPTSEDELVNFLSDDKRYKEFDKDTIINPEVKDALYFLHRINYVKNNNGQLKITDKYLNDIEEKEYDEYEKSKNSKSDKTQTLDDKKNDEFKTIFKDEITYLDLIIPVINIVNENTIGENLLFEKIRSIDKFKKYDDDLILKKIRKTIFYITQLNYTAPTINNEIKITQKGIEYQNELSKKIQKIRQKDLTS